MAPRESQSSDRVAPLSKMVHTTVVSEASPPPVQGPLRLVVLSGEERGGVHAAKGETLVGRDETAALCLRHPSVSRRHAVLIRLDKGWCVQDCGSTNGTYVNGSRVAERSMLRQGDIIAFGAVVVKLHVSDAPPTDGRSPGIEKVDPQSGACSGAYLRERLEAEVARCYQLQRPVSVLSLEIDRFETVRAARGDHAADQLLRQITSLLQARIRTSDLFARTNEQCFGVMLSEVPLPIAVRIARRLVQALHDHSFGSRHAGLNVTTSVGAASTEGRWISANELLIAAERSMERAADAGGDRIRA